MSRHTAAIPAATPTALLAAPSADQQRTAPDQAVRPGALTAEDTARFRSLLAGLESSLRADRREG